MGLKHPPKLRSRLSRGIFPSGWMLDVTGLGRGGRECGRACGRGGPGRPGRGRRPRGAGEGLPGSRELCPQRLRACGPPPPARSAQRESALTHQPRRGFPPSARVRPSVRAGAAAPVLSCTPDALGRSARSRAVLQLLNPDQAGNWLALF